MKQIINPGDVEDVYYTVMNTENGITIISEFNYGAPCIPEWIVQGDRGTIYIKDYRVEIHKTSYPVILDSSVYSNKATVEIIKGEDGRITPQNQYGDAMQIYAHISRALRGMEPYRVTTGDALTLTRTLDAIRISAESGKVVEL